MNPARRFALSSWLDLVLLASALLPLTVVSSSPLRTGVGAFVTLISVTRAELRRSWKFWGVLATLYAAWYWTDWTSLDNHAWLMPVWFAAVGVSLRLDGRGTELGTQARVLVALVFVFALGWKLRSPDFISGAFFEFTLLTDPRFAPLATWAGVGSDALAANQLAAASGPQTAFLAGGPHVRVLATVLTVGTLVIEGAVALAWALKRVPDWWRHGSLAFFCIATYLIAPVAGFGLVLLAMGAAITRTPRAARAYLAAMAVLFVWSGIWNAVVL